MAFETVGATCAHLQYWQTVKLKKVVAKERIRKRKKTEKEGQREKRGREERNMGSPHGKFR